MARGDKIAILLPCFNEEEVLPITLSALRRKLPVGVTIICVDDGSFDGTWDIISKKSVVGIKLAHNVGQQRALMAGLMFAREHGFDAVISLDADLQDDVDIIGKMLKKYHAGADIVYGVRKSRKSDGFLKRSSARIFYRIMKILGVEMVADSPDFRLLSKRALDALSEYGEYNLILKGIIPSIGLRSEKVYYERKKRAGGKSKYSYLKLINVALDSVTSFSVRPLRFLLLVGFLFSVLGVGMIVYVCIEYFLNKTISGWPFIVCSIWLNGGCIMVSIGILGEYIGRIYLETKKRPRYFIEKVSDRRKSARLKEQKK